MIETKPSATNLLAAVVAFQQQFIAEDDPRPAFEAALRLLLEISDSECGFIGEVMHSATGATYLKAVVSNVPWDVLSCPLDARLASDGVEIHSLPPSFGEGIRAGKVVISNTPASVRGTNHVPSGQLGTRSFLGLPLIERDGLVVGFVGLANRPDGYDERAAQNLQSIGDALGAMLASAQRDAQRRADETAIRESEARYRTFVDQASEAFFLQDNTGRVLDANRQACASLGYERHELIGKAPPDFDPNFSHEQVAALLGKMEVGQTVTFESLHRRKDGTTFPVEIFLCPFSSDGERQHVALVRDITERKQAEDRLRESESRLRTMLESLEQIAVQGYEPDGTITFWNRASELFYGYSASEVMGRDLVELLHGEQTRAEERRIMAEAIRTRVPLAADEVEVVRRDGTKITVYASRIVHQRPGRTPEFFCFDVDVTASKRAKLQIQDQYALLHTILESTSDFIYMKDVEGHYLMMNSAGAAAVGKPVDEIIGQTDYDIFPAEVARQVADSDRRVLADGATHRFDETICFGTTIKNLSTAKSPCLDSNGQIIGIVGVTRDVTARVHATQALHEAQQRLALILKGAEVGLWDWDLETNEVEFSDEWKSQLGYDSDEIASRFEDWRSRVHPEDLAPTLEKVHSTIERCSSDYRVEFRMRHKDGSWRWILSMGFAIAGRDGRAARMVGVHIDITDRKRAEESLKESEERYRLALDAANLGTWRHDYATREVKIDPQAQLIWGFDRPVVAESEFVDRIHSDDLPRVSERVAETLLPGASRNFAVEFRIFRPNGELRWIALRGYVDSVDEGATRRPIVSIGTYLDITERKRLDAERERLHEEVLQSREQLRAMSRRVIEAQESERRHLALELHDEIGQILTTVNLGLESLRSRIDPAYEYRLEDGVRIVNQAIEQVRDLSLNLRPASLDILGLEAALRAYAKRQCSRAGFVAEVASSLGEQRLSPMLETVCFRIAQEALTNVIRHANAAHCWIELACQGGEVFVSIRDDGIGFDPAEIRERGHRGESFGLLGMQERSHLFNGRFEVESSPGAGTVVRARFPLLPFESMERISR